MEIDIYKILEYLPHRYPFLLIDRVLQLDSGKSITALKNVTINEPYFTGHFPNEPVMPGVIMIEALAQSAGILALVTQSCVSAGEAAYVLAGVDNARFKQIVKPGDQLHLHIELQRERQDIWKFAGKAVVGERVVCTAELILAGRKSA